MGTKDDKVMRSFDTGATRDTAEGKLDYEGFLSPVVLEQFAKFMNMNRLQSDGQLRDSDNWQKGIPMDVYRKSLMRHYMEFWMEQRRPKGCQTRIDTIGAACGMLFNIMGWMHEWLKTHDMVEFDGDEPTIEMRERRAKIKEEAKKDYAEAFDQYVQGNLDSPGIMGFTGNPDHLCKDSNDCPICDDVEEWSCPKCFSINQVGDPCFCEINDMEASEDDDECDCCGAKAFESHAPDCLYVTGDEDVQPSCTYNETGCSDCECEVKKCEDTQPGEVPLPDWVPSEEPKTFPSLPGAMQALYDAVGEDNILGIRVETKEKDLVCTECRFGKCSFMDHPCDCCDDNYSNFSRKE